MRREKRYREPGCSRLKVRFWQEGVRPPEATAPRQHTREFGCNCRLENCSRKKAEKEGGPRELTPQDKVQVESQSGYAFNPAHAFETFNLSSVAAQGQRGQIREEAGKFALVRSEHQRRPAAGRRREKVPRPVPERGDAVGVEHQPFHPRFASQQRQRERPRPVADAETRSEHEGRRTPVVEEGRKVGPVVDPAQHDGGQVGCVDLHGAARRQHGDGPCPAARRRHRRKPRRATHGATPCAASAVPQDRRETTAAPRTDADSRGHRCP